MCSSCSRTRESFQSWTSDGFKTSLFKFIRRLECEGIIAPGLTFQGLRHTVATELRELGFDTGMIADMLGQKSKTMAGHYNRDADLREKLKPPLERSESAGKMRTEMSGKSKKSVSKPRPATEVIPFRVLISMQVNGLRHG